ncbi:MAG: DUF917 domain-containing protein [Synergistaceae bacterium]|jgi:DUF917 family protein|nr:DUF917 domain-containing protein [Synergistaceae bacterium]
MKILDKTDVHDMLYGCTIMGCGGGGPLERGLRLADKALLAGKTFKLADYDDIPDEDYLATPYYCGSISPETEDERKKYERLAVKHEEPTVEATRRLERFLGVGIKGFVSTELGGGNTAIPLYLAAISDRYVIDGDAAGRAVPDLQMSLYFVNGLPITPMSLVNAFGDAAVLTEVVDDFRAEALARALAVASKNTIAIVDHPAKASEIKKTIIRGALSHAMRVGRAWREALDAGKSAAESVAVVGGGRTMFKGELKSFEWNTVDGFTVGEMKIVNSAGDELKIWFKNEHIVSWLNGAQYVCAPDLICLLEAGTGKPLTNPNYEKGMKIDAVALPAPEGWTTKRGLEVLSPVSFGFDFEWRSFRKLKL